MSRQFGNAGDLSNNGFHDGMTVKYQRNDSQHLMCWDHSGGRHEAHRTRCPATTTVRHQESLGWEGEEDWSGTILLKSLIVLTVYRNFYRILWSILLCFQKAQISGEELVLSREVERACCIVISTPVVNQTWWEVGLLVRGAINGLKLSTEEKKGNYTWITVIYIYYVHTDLQNLSLLPTLSCPDTQWVQTLAKWLWISYW